VRRVLLAVLTAALACGSSPRHREFRLRIAVVGPLRDPAPGGEPSASAYAQEWVFEPLLRTAPDGSPLPGLAARFHFLDPAHVVVELREGAKFSDGSAVTAKDVGQSLRDAGLVVHEEPRGLVIESPAGAPVEPVLLQRTIFKRTGDAAVGSGPFRVVSLDPARLLLRRRNREPGKIDEVLFLGFPTAREPFAHTLAGDADLLIVTDPKQLEFFQGMSRLRIIRAHSVQAIAVAMGFHRLDRASRTAIAAALPVETISRLVFGKECLPFSRPGGETTALPRRALDVLVLREDPHFERTALAVARALGRSGGEIRFVSLGDAFRLLKSQDFDLMMLRPLVWPPSAAAFWASDSPLNELRYRNPRVDESIKAGDWARAMHELRDDPPVAFICTPERLALVDSRIKNAQVGPYGYLETLPDWEVEE